MLFCEFFQLPVFDASKEGFRIPLSEFEKIKASKTGSSFCSRSRKNGGVRIR
jgi:hypothetical protein